jgi:hypothetical protein
MEHPIQAHFMIRRKRLLVAVRIQETLMMMVTTTVQSGAISRLATTTTAIGRAHTSLLGVMARGATVTVLVVAG